MSIDNLKHVVALRGSALQAVGRGVVGSGKDSRGGRLESGKVWVWQQPRSRLGAAGGLSGIR